MDTTYFIYTSLIWSLCWALYRVLLSADVSHQLNRLYLLLSFVLGLTWSVWMPLLPSTPLAEVVGRYTLPTLEVGGAEMINASASTSPSVWSYLWYAYLLGCGLVGVRFLWQAGMLIGLISRSERKWVGGICWVRGPEVEVAGSWFWFLFLPDSPLAAQDQREIELHERAHIQQGHSWDMLLLELTGILFWWNPLWYAYNYSLRQVHEYQADAVVLRHRVSVRHYAEILLRQLSPSTNQRLVSTFYTSPLKQRIIMMTKKSSIRRTLWKYALLLPLLACIVLACADGGDQLVTNAETQALLKASDEVEGEVYDEVDQMPVFGDCEGLSGEDLTNCSNRRLLEHIYTNVKYPKEAFEKEIEGTALTEFVVTSTGTVAQVQTLTSDKVEGHEVLDEEALRVMAELPPFRPGMKDGKPVNVRMVLPVKFKLQ